MWKLLFISTSVGVLGSGQGGGVELTVLNLAQALQARGHQVDVLAPVGSRLPGVRIQEIEGNLQVPAQTQGRDIGIMMPDNPVLANMLDYARQVQSNYDLIVNFAFDWLPFYLTPFFQIPIAHLISMGSLCDALDRMMAQIAVEFPGTLATHSRVQANTFSFGAACRVVGNGLDLSLYQFCEQPQDYLIWLGRIAPEKALEDAIAASKITNIPLRIFGQIQDQDYWQQIQRDFADVNFEYGGFLPTLELQAQLGQARALLMTPRWVEAFGNVAIEALACGVPVISYHRGGPAEIIKDGITGFLVEPDSITGLVEAIAKLDQIKRSQCRQQAELEYSLTALSDRFEAWFQDILDNIALY